LLDRFRDDDLKNVAITGAIIPVKVVNLKHTKQLTRMIGISAMLTLFLSSLFFWFNRIAETSGIFGPSISKGLEFINILISKGGFTS